MKILYFDTETTGLDEVENDIITIAGLIEIDGKVLEDFHFKCQPHNFETVTKEASDVHGYSIEDMKKFDHPRDIYLKLINIFSRHIDKYNRADKFHPAGQNVRFDIGFLKQFFLKCGDKYYGSWLNYQTVDLLALTSILKMAGKIDVPNLKLETMAKYCGIELKAHDALEDIKATREVMNILMKRHLK